MKGKKPTEAVTIYDKHWEVRESIVPVDVGDEFLQQGLSKIGYHFVEEGRDGLEAAKGTVLMGRHELTTKKELGSMIPGVELEFHDGVLRTCRSRMSHNQALRTLHGTSTEIATSTETATCPGTLPEVPIVTSNTLQSPDRKKLKSNPFSTEP